MPDNRVGGDPGPTDIATRSGGECDVALVINLGAYWFAATLAVVICLHRHASLESTSRVETVHPLVVCLTQFNAWGAGDHPGYGGRDNPTMKFAVFLMVAALSSRDPGLATPTKETSHDHHH
jgi:hypothetical protein